MTAMKRPSWILPASLLTLAALSAGIYWFRTGGIESALLAEAPYPVLKQHARAEYSRVLAAFREFRAGDSTEMEFLNVASAQYAQAATRRLAHASQDSVLALMRDTLTTVKKLAARSPETCFRYWFPEVAGPAEVAQVLEPGDLRRTLLIMSQVVSTAAANPVVAPDPEEVKEPLANIVNALYEQYGADAQMVAHAEDPRADRAKVCTITTAVYERILALPPETSSKLIRVMAAGQ
jgi:hypothetical protein